MHGLGWSKEHEYNGTFSYGGGTFHVYVIAFSYSWDMQTKGSSNARRRQTTYPFRRVQSALSVTLQFESEARMLEFAQWARQYHLAVTQPAGGDSPGNFPRLWFSSSEIPGQDGQMGVLYCVALPSIPVKLSYDAVAPTLSLTLDILTSGDQHEVAASQASGTFSEYMKAVNTVTPSEVGASGDDSFVGPVKKAVIGSYYDAIKNKIS